MRDDRLVRLLLEHEGRRFFVATDGVPGGRPFDGAAFPVLVWDRLGTSTADERHGLAQALIRGGCRYAVCGGANSSDWERAFDVAFVMDHLDDPEQGCPDALVMTTSHVGEPPDEVAFFFVTCTDFDHWRFRECLVIHIGSGPLQHAVEEAVSSHALGRDDEWDA
jgi:hypothetical protein